MRNIVFLILAFATSISFAALPKRMCFESYPRTTYDASGVHNWTVNEILASKTAYKTYQLITVSQVKDKSGFYNFTFGGHARNNADITFPVSGVGYEYGGKYKIELQSAFLVGRAGSTEIAPVVSALAFWDMYTMTGPEPGTSSFATLIPNNNLLPTPVNNVYQVDVVKPIPCDQYHRTTPTN